MLIPNLFENNYDTVSGLWIRRPTDVHTFPMIIGKFSQQTLWWMFNYCTQFKDDRGYCDVYQLNRRQKTVWIHLNVEVAETIGPVS